jgi:hypothetical protein
MPELAMIRLPLLRWKHGVRCIQKKGESLLVSPSTVFQSPRTYIYAFRGTGGWPIGVSVPANAKLSRAEFVRRFTNALRTFQDWDQRGQCPEGPSDDFGRDSPPF